MRPWNGWPASLGDPQISASAVLEVNNGSHPAGILSRVCSFSLKECIMLMGLAVRSYTISLCAQNIWALTPMTPLLLLTL